MSHSKDTAFYDPNTSGLCRCGCGEETPLATRTVWRYGNVKGKPVQFLTGHHRRLSPVDYVEEDRGYKTPCHVWKLGLDGKGYGQYAVPGGKGKSIPAHVAAYEEKYGPVPEGMMLDHLCRVRACRNPDHVEPVTCAENLRRGINTKLTRDQVDEIRRLYAHGGHTQAALADRFGVAHGYVCQIVNFKTWRD